MLFERIRTSGLDQGSVSLVVAFGAHVLLLLPAGQDIELSVPFLALCLPM